MASRRVYLATAILMFLLVLVPVLLLLSAPEDRAMAPTLLFWLLLLLPVVVLPWLVLWRAAQRGARAGSAAPGAAADDSLERFSDMVAPFVSPERTYIDGGLPVVEGVAQTAPSHLFEQLDRRLAPWGFTPLVESIHGHGVRVIGLPRSVAERFRERPPVVVPSLLFVAAVATTVFAGATQRGVDLLAEPGRFAVGLPYALALLGILGVHELGHYVVARRYGVSVSLPFFIPVPMGLGTFGAFIQIKSLIRSRQAVFDIGIAGPLAGLAIAVPALYVGLHSVEPAGMTRPGIDTGSSIALAVLYQLAHGGELGATTVALSPVAFAGWIGLFVTALNLVPVGQLDGGHIAYGLFGRRHARAIGVGAVVLLATIGLLVWPGLLTWALLIALLAGFSHMPALDDVSRPPGSRYALGALALAILLVIVLPVPW